MGQIVRCYPQVPIDLLDIKGDTQAINFLESLDGILLGDRSGNISLDAVEVTPDNVHALGWCNPYYPHIVPFCYDITIDRKSTEVRKTTFADPWWEGATSAVLFSLGLYALTKGHKERRRQKREYNANVTRIRAANIADAETKIAPITVYQGDLAEVARTLGRPLERVDTRNPAQFLQAADLFWLRVQAYLCGADAIIHYAPGSAIGTPVRFADK